MIIVMAKTYKHYQKITTIDNMTRDKCIGDNADDEDKDTCFVHLRLLNDIIFKVKIILQDQFKA